MPWIQMIEHISVFDLDELIYDMLNAWLLLLNVSSLPIILHQMVSEQHYLF